MQHNSKTNGASDTAANARMKNSKDLRDNSTSATNNHSNQNTDEDDLEDPSNEIIELNNRVKTDLTSYCLSFLSDDEDTRQIVQMAWSKYLQCVGDTPMLSAFFDILPFPVRAAAMPKYLNDISIWFENLFRIRCNSIIHTSTNLESLLLIIRYVQRATSQETTDSMKKGIIYLPTDFDLLLKNDLLALVPNIQFEHCKSHSRFQDLIDINQLEKLLENHAQQIETYPMMIIAQAGTSAFGHSDDLVKLKQLCNKYKLWLHTTGDVLGSLALVPVIDDKININADSLTFDLSKIIGIPNLPYLTIFIKPVMKFPLVKLSESAFASDSSLSTDAGSIASTQLSTSSNGIPPLAETNSNDHESLVSKSLYDALLNTPSVGLLSVWSLGQRCQKETILYHMKHSFSLANYYLKKLRQVPLLKIVNDLERKEKLTYRSIFSGAVPDEVLPSTVVIFRYETEADQTHTQMDDSFQYIDLLNLWLFNKLVEKYPKLNLELVKSAEFQASNTNINQEDRVAVHAIRFAPLEHLLDAVDQSDIDSLTDDLQHYCDILLATMTARANLSSILTKYENLISVPVPNWAGIGAVQYVSTETQSSETEPATPMKSYNVNTIQAELARKLQADDSAFSLGTGTEEHDSQFCIRLGMIRKRDDLNVLLQKIEKAGKETEISLKYVQDMAEKIVKGIEQVQQDLKNENEQLLAQEGILRQLPVISNIMSWWSPSPSASPLATKGRSFDLNSGRVESTEDTYAYRMQIRKQSSDAPMHNDRDIETNATSTTDPVNDMEKKQ